MLHTQNTPRDVLVAELRALLQQAGEFQGTLHDLWDAIRQQVRGREKRELTQAHARGEDGWSPALPWMRCYDAFVDALADPRLEPLVALIGYDLVIDRGSSSESISLTPLSPGDLPGTE